MKVKIIHLSIVILLLIIFIFCRETKMDTSLESPTIPRIESKLKEGGKVLPSSSEAQLSTLSKTKQTQTSLSPLPSDLDLK